MNKLLSILYFKTLGWISGISQSISMYFLQLRGLSVGKNTSVAKLRINWPHQVIIGKNTILEENTFIKYSKPYEKGKAIYIGDNVFIGNGCEFNITKSITIENNVLISSGCKFIDHDHGFHQVNQSIATQPQVEKPIKICEGAWLGVNSVLLKGVVVGSGAIVGAGSVVTKNIPSNEIWAGVPATKIGSRSERIIKKRATN
jgi:acetyltransferase-like isoleucine patch superfamily enzyme